MTSLRRLTDGCRSEGCIDGVSSRGVLLLLGSRYRAAYAGCWGSSRRGDRALPIARTKASIAARQLCLILDAAAGWRQRSRSREPAQEVEITPGARASAGQAR